MFVRCLLLFTQHYCLSWCFLSNDSLLSYLFIYFIQFNRSCWSPSVKHFNYIAIDEDGPKLPYIISVKARSRDHVFQGLINSRKGVFIFNLFYYYSDWLQGFKLFSIPDNFFGKTLIDTIDHGHILKYFQRTFPKANVLKYDFLSLAVLISHCLGSRTCRVFPILLPLNCKIDKYDCLLFRYVIYSFFLSLFIYLFISIYLFFYISRLFIHSFVSIIFFLCSWFRWRFSKLGPKDICRLSNLLQRWSDKSFGNVQKCRT
jgi:hypothetical protein